MRNQQPEELHPQELAQVLRQSTRRPAESRRVAVIETHFAWVFLTDTLAYKIKKRMHHRSMDYRTLAHRKWACNAELRLNRRLARSVYLGVIPVVRRRDGSVGLGRGQQVIDWAVKMRRLPSERMLDRAIAEHTIAAHDVLGVAKLLSTFFVHARPATMPARAYLARLRSQIIENRHDLRAPQLRLSKRRLESVIRAQLEFIVKGASLLGLRASRLIDGHGDLRPEHIFLGGAGEHPCVMDCLEFDRDLRRLDPAEELAFLALECTRLGDRRFGTTVARQVALTMNDPVPNVIMHFYMSHRAAVRAKIAAWHQLDAQFAGSSHYWRASGNSYLLDALRYIRLALRALDKAAD